MECQTELVSIEIKIKLITIDSMSSTSIDEIRLNVICRGLSWIDL